MLPISLQPQLAGTAQPALCLTAALLKPCALQAERGFHETEGSEKKARRKQVWVLLPELIPPSAATGPTGNMWGWMQGKESWCPAVPLSVEPGFMPCCSEYPHFGLHTELRPV